MEGAEIQVRAVANGDEDVDDILAELDDFDKVLFLLAANLLIFSLTHSLFTSCLAMPCMYCACV